MLRLMTFGEGRLELAHPWALRKPAGFQDLPYGVEFFLSHDGLSDGEEGLVVGHDWGLLEYEERQDACAVCPKFGSANGLKTGFG